MVADWFIMFYVKMIVSAILILLQIHIFAKCCLPLKVWTFKTQKPFIYASSGEMGSQIFVFIQACHSMSWLDSTFMQ